MLGPLPPRLSRTSSRSEGNMTRRSLRSTRIARALVLLPTALCVTGVVVAVQHEDETAGLRSVADPTTAPSSTPSSTPASTPLFAPAPAPAAAVTLMPGAGLAPATVIPGASVTRVRPGHVTSVASSAVAPLAGRRALTAIDTTPAASAVAGIGVTALAAYQRAAAVVDQANTSCRLDWTLLAGIGAVESGHGTYGGSELDTAGMATPEIQGPVLDGRHHTRRIADTDAGRLDHDTRYDRALGPMQILPATWLQIAVDADGDGRRDPQDINDAALAAAVYLCSAGDDLSTPAGARAAVLRYNHSATYADTVLGLAAGYGQDTSTTSLVGLVTSGGGVVSAVDAQPAAEAPKHHPHAPKQHVKPHAPEQHAVWHQTSHPAPQHPVAPPAPAAAPKPPAAAPKPPATAPEPPATAPEPPTTPPTDTPAPLVREAACRNAIVAAYPRASTDAVASAVAACIQAVTGLSDDRAEDALPHLVAGLAASVPGLEPAPVTAPADDASPAPQEPVSP